MKKINKLDFLFLDGDKEKTLEYIEDKSELKALEDKGKVNELKALEDEVLALKTENDGNILKDENNMFEDENKRLKYEVLELKLKLKEHDEERQSIMRWKTERKNWQEEDAKFAENQRKSWKGCL